MKILAIGAHPDDLEYGCGGTLLKLAAMGHKIHILVMTGGEMGGSPTVRRKEQERSSRILKAKLYWGKFTDTNIPLSKDLINKIEEVINQVRPSLIFVHHFDDTHQDHRKVSQAATTATRYFKNVVFFESLTTITFNPTVYVDITSVMSKKYTLVKAHKSQVFQTKIPNHSIIENVRSTAIFRGYQHRCKYAEGFIPLRLSLDFHLERNEK